MFFSLWKSPHALFLPMIPCPWRRGPVMKLQSWYQRLHRNR